MKANGHVFKYGDNVDTDVIIPARYLNSPDGNELAKHCMEDIDKEFVNKGRYGVRRVYMELKNRGYDVNHKRVQRLMHDVGLLGKRPKEKYHSYKGEVGKVADNVINRDFSTK